MSTPEKDAATDALSECLLKQIKFCVAGVLVGGVIGVTKKTGVVPMVTGGETDVGRYLGERRA